MQKKACLHASELKAYLAAVLIMCCAVTAGAIRISTTPPSSWDEFAGHLYLGDVREVDIPADLAARGRFRATIQIGGGESTRIMFLASPDTNLPELLDEHGVPYRIDPPRKKDTRLMIHVLPWLFMIIWLGVIVTILILGYRLVRAVEHIAMRMDKK